MTSQSLDGRVPMTGPPDFRTRELERAAMQASMTQRLCTLDGPTGTTEYRNFALRTWTREQIDLDQDTEIGGASPPDQHCDVYLFALLGHAGPCACAITKRDRSSMDRRGRMVEVE